MEKPVAAVELSSRSIKIVVGYVLNDQVHVIYTLTKPLDFVIDRGNFINPQVLDAAIKEIKTIEDSSAKLRINIQDILFALPPFGLEVKQTSQITNVVNEEGIVSGFDLKNVFALVRKCNDFSNATLVDVIPSQYLLDKGRVFDTPPVGEISSSLQVYALMYYLPTRIIDEYTHLMKLNGISIRRNVVSPIATVELIASYGNQYPVDYFLVDIGSDITTVSLIGHHIQGHNEVVGSRFFSWGGHHITKHIVDSFQINEADAEKFKIMYGLDEREMAFDSVVCTSEIDGNEYEHKVSELNRIIREELEIFVREYLSSLNSVLETYNDPRYKELPIVLVGGGSALFGLNNFLISRIPNKKIIIATPKTLGARNPSYFNCLGMIYLNSKYSNNFDDNIARVGSLTRNSKEEDK